MRLLPPEWYHSEDVVTLARDLLGKVLETRFEGHPVRAMITETEAYRGPEDRASHSWNNRRTARTEVMYAAGGVAYVYLCYGIHHLFNVVTGPAGIPHAVLVRGLHPLEGEAHMLARRGLVRPRRGWLDGPGSAARAMGLHTTHSGLSLWKMDSPVTLRDAGALPSPDEILVGPRVGIDYAGLDALLPWRFRWVRRATEDR